jgi:membrane associated rhomboid family serine protease
VSSPRPSPRPRPPADTSAAKATSKPAKAPSAAEVFGVDKQRREPPLNPRSWSGALILMLVMAAVLWVIEIINDNQDDSLAVRFGLMPRQAGGLWGIVTMPFLHDSYGHLASNTLPFVLIGWVVMLSGLRLWSVVTVGIVLIGDFATWVIGPSHTVIVGASGLVFGWLGYLLARAVFSRRLKWIFTALAVLFFFGTLLFGLFPTLHSDTSWQAHVCGFAAGVVVAFVLHPRQQRLSRRRRPAVS